LKPTPRRDKLSLMKKILFKQIMLIAAAVLLASCATVPANVSEKSVGSVINVLNSGDSSKIAEITSTPFLLDRELLENEARVVWFWDMVLAGDFNMSDSVVIQAKPAGEAWKSFFEPSEFMNLWYGKYVSEKALFAHVENEKHELYLIIDKNKKDNVIKAVRMIK